MSDTKKQNVNNGQDRPPQWLIDELKRDPGLLRVVADIVRSHRKRSPNGKNRRR